MTQYKVLTKKNRIAVYVNDEMDVWVRKKAIEGAEDVSSYVRRILLVEMKKDTNA